MQINSIALDEILMIVSNDNLRFLEKYFNGFCKNSDGTSDRVLIICDNITFAGFIVPFYVSILFYLT